MVWCLLIYWHISCYVMNKTSKLFLRWFCEEIKEENIPTFCKLKSRQDKKVDWSGSNSSLFYIRKRKVMGAQRSPSIWTDMDWKNMWDAHISSILLEKVSNMLLICWLSKQVSSIVEMEKQHVPNLNSSRSFREFLFQKCCQFHIFQYKLGVKAKKQLSSLEVNQFVKKEVFFHSLATL